VDEIARVQARQAGVISRRQILDLGGTMADIERALRRRDLVRMLPGVFLDHTGSPTWLQRAWAGVLYYEPAALGGLSALRAVTGPGWRRHPDNAPIEVAVDTSRNVRALPGYRPVRRARIEEESQWNASPPRLRIEHAVLDLAATAPSDLEAVAVLTDTVQLRRTTAPRILSALVSRPRIARRAWLQEVLSDIAEGTTSVLEHGYLVRVERPHGLPHGWRQRMETVGPRRYRDVVYAEFEQVVELDGRLFHDSADARDADLDRDLDAAVERLGTVRLGWGQVFGRPCRTAARLALILRRRGWAGRPRPCGPGCAVVDIV
jgi:hypothetical protein